MLPVPFAKGGGAGVAVAAFAPFRVGSAFEVDAAFLDFERAMRSAMRSIDSADVMTNSRRQS